LGEREGLYTEATPDRILGGGGRRLCGGRSARPAGRWKRRRAWEGMDECATTRGMGVEG
jgi:hypothetical protein